MSTSTRITKESSIILAEVLNNRQMIMGFVAANYSADPEGLLLFKADCQEYEMTKQLAILDKREVRNTKYSLSIIGDGKGSAHKFALTSVDGKPFYCGCFLEPKTDVDPGSKQCLAEARAFINALRLCRDYCYYKNIDIRDFTLHYFTDSKPTFDAAEGRGMTYTSHIIRAAIKDTGINLKIDWIRGTDNLADRYTLPEGEVIYPDYKMMDEYLKG